MGTHAAREKSGLGDTLSFKSLILMRFVSIFASFFVLSVSKPAHHLHWFLTTSQLLYSLLAMAFQLKFTRK